MSRSSVAQPDRDLLSVFNRLARYVGDQPQSDEILFAGFNGEHSEFTRFNHSRVRQIGRVERMTARLHLMAGARQAVMQCTLTGSDDDFRVLREAHDTLRRLITVSAIDPWLDFDREARVLHQTQTAQMPSPREVIDAVRASAGVTDLVAFQAAGPVACGLVSSLGHRLYHEHAWYDIGFTVHAAGDRAIQDSVSASQWDRSALEHAISSACQRAKLLRREPLVLAPGAYRVALSPRALADLAGMLAWDGFSARARVTGISPLARLWSGQQTLSKAVSMCDDLAQAGVPAFHELGFARPASLKLIDAGRGARELVCARSAREFGLTSTGAADAESPQGLRIESGKLADAELLSALGDGLMVNQFWYLNHSDRAAARATGMTRFATWLVRDGEPVAPVAVMRFDDSLYSLLGDALLGLGDRVHWFANSDTWEARRFGGVAAPAALIGGMNFAL
jgi:predicted Zn-dependent protease